MSFSASATIACAAVFGSALAGLPPSLPFLADVFSLRLDVLLPRRAACLLVSFMR